MNKRMKERTHTRMNRWRNDALNDGWMPGVESVGYSCRFYNLTVE